MLNKKKTAALVLASALMASATGFHSFAATAHFNDGTTGSDWSAWTESWNEVSQNYELVSLTPGADETKMNFGWYSKSGAAATPVVELSLNADMSGATQFAGTVTPAVDGYQSNKATVSGLKENTTYYYRYYKNGVPSETASFTTHSFSSYQMLYVGDPQIGASKGQTAADGTALNYAADALNTAARNDAYNWNQTLNTALKANPNISFILSAGDQINKNVNGTDSGNEVEYAGYLNAEALKSLPVATTIGNHDATNQSYTFHFNNPNTTGLGMTEAGGDYFYKYGDAVFIVLNTNNYNCAEHEAVIKEALRQHPDTAWRIVMFHQDIYGSGLDHSDSDGIVLRTQLTPIMDKYDIDVVLQGHDHTYSRSYLLEGDGKTHSNYDFYDWDNVKDTAGNVYPYADASYQADNNCYTIADQTQGKVTNPKGTLYMEANSSTGSKYYELIPAQQDYIAARSQNWNPTYSVISLTPSAFTIDTYEVVNGQPKSLDQTFTIEKTAKRTQTVSAAGNEKPAAGASTAKTSSALPATGDTTTTTRPAVYVMIAVVAACTLWLLFYRKKED